MPAIKSTSRSELFRDLQRDADIALENNDCAVKAVAIACNAPYNKVLEIMTTLGRKPRKGTHMGIIYRTIKLLGYTWVNRPARDFIDQYPKAHRILKNVTTHHPERFNKVWANGKTYLLVSPSHILAVVDGVNHDWTKGRALRATMILEVLPRD